MRKKTIEKKAFQLPFSTRLALAFNLTPNDLVQARHVFENALSLTEAGSLKTWARRKYQGRIIKFSKVWHRVFRAWVRLCDVRKEELKGAFFSATKYSFFVPGKDKVDTGDSPLLQVVVEAWLQVLEPSLHIDDHEDLWNLACGNWSNCPHSRWQQLALMKWMSAAHNNEEHNRGITLCKPGTIPHETYVLNKPNGGYRGE